MFCLSRKICIDLPPLTPPSRIENCFQFSYVSPDSAVLGPTYAPDGKMGRDTQIPGRNNYEIFRSARISTKPAY